MKLGKKEEALKILDITEKLANHKLESVEKDLNNAYGSVDKELKEAIAQNVESILKYIKNLRLKLLGIIDAPR